MYQKVASSIRQCFSLPQIKKRESKMRKDNTLWDSLMKYLPDF